MAHAAPGKDYRDGISLVELKKMFPDEEAARKWFERIVWGPEGKRYCPNCGSENTYECAHAKMPYKCRERECGKYFSVKTGTVMARSKVTLRQWVFAIYLDTTSLKGISSMKLHRDIKVTQKTAWFMLQRIREAWKDRNVSGKSSGPVEADETYVGGQRKNMSNAQRKALKEAETGRGPAGKVAVVGVKDRDTKRIKAKVVESTDAATRVPFVEHHTRPDDEVYTDESKPYSGVQNRKSVKHSAQEYVRGDVHINGVESFWSMFKRAYKGTFHKLSPKHLNRYIQEFAGKQNIRELGTEHQMAITTARLIGKRLPYVELVADNGLSSGARSG